MTLVAEKALNALERFDDTLQMTVLKNDADIALCDEVKANDDGCRISSSDLRKKHGMI